MSTDDFARWEASLGPAVVVVVSASTVVRERLWCERCNLSTAVEVDVIAEGMVVATLGGCERCRSGICHDPTS